MRENELTDQIIGAAIEVHRHLGPSLLELKAIEDLAPIDSAQLLTYRKASEKHVGLPVNFKVPVLKDGLKRIVNEFSGFSPRLSPRLRVSAVNPDPEPCCNDF